jgi:type II secretory pathway pseudopilin PulG
MSKNGFTLMEIIVAAVLFSLVIVGMLSVFITGNKQVIHARERMISSELGKLFVDPMQAHVRQDTWDLTTNALYIPALPTTSFTSYCDAVGGHTQNPICLSMPASERKINNRDFSAQYDVSRVCNGVCSSATDTGMRRVTTTLTWQEPATY